VCRHPVVLTSFQPEATYNYESHIIYEEYMQMVEASWQQIFTGTTRDGPILGSIYLLHLYLSCLDSFVAFMIILKMSYPESPVYNWLYIVALVLRFLGSVIFMVSLAPVIRQKKVNCLRLIAMEFVLSPLFFCFFHLSLIYLFPNIFHYLFPNIL